MSVSFNFLLYILERMSIDETAKNAPVVTPTTNPAVGMKIPVGPSQFVGRANAKSGTSANELETFGCASVAVTLVMFRSLQAA